jgi:hypothetical protein
MKELNNIYTIIGQSHIYYGEYHCDQEYVAIRDTSTNPMSSHSYHKVFIVVANDSITVD